MISPESNKTSKSAMIDDSPRSYRKSIFKTFMRRKSSSEDVSPVNTKSLNRISSVKSKKSDNSFIDQDDMSIFNSDDENDMSPHDADTSETSSTYSNLHTTDSFIGKSTLMDEKSSEIIDAKLYELLQSNNEVEEPNLAWEDFKHESLMVPKYAKPNRRKNSPEMLKRLFLAQELNDDTESDSHSVSEDSVEHDVTSQNPIINSKISKEIFVMQFSRDGKYLAVAGRDSVIKVWKVICSPLGRMEYNNYEAHHKSQSKSPAHKHHEDTVYPYAPVFHQKPVKVFKGHSNSVLSIDWSKNNFLVSGSMDKTVKLWHIDRSSALATFQHEDFVTTVKFHPNDDRFFLSGSLDNQARIWSILERNIAYGRYLGDEMLITAANFTPDGLHCVFGGFNGNMAVLETKGLHILNKFDIKQKSIVPLSNTNGNKVTNIKVLKTSDDDQTIDYRKWSYLVTTNDSRIRLVSIKDKKLVTRFKGATNSGSIEASITDDYRYVLSGSEDHWVYIWENNNQIINNNLRGAVKEMINDGVHQLNQLEAKHEKYYKLLLKNKLFNKLHKEVLHNNEIDLISNENSSYASFHAHHSNVNAAIFAPNSTKKLLELSDDLIFDLLKRARLCSHLHKFDDIHLPEEEEVDYGNQGLIIITTDDYGLIRVFRHDPAYEVRNRILRIYKKSKDSDFLPCDMPRFKTDKPKLSKKKRCSETSTPSSMSVPTISKTRPVVEKAHSSQSSTPQSSKSGTRHLSKSISTGIISSNNASLAIHTAAPVRALDSVRSMSPPAVVTPEQEIHEPFPSIETSAKTVIPRLVETPPTSEFRNVSLSPSLKPLDSKEDLKDLKIKRVNK
ncbi:WD repeat-containing protein [[Candida] jaroonii]|uniref:WD repeat-containing protein n=1 Tax=[Candida] jaroonii TaxID=467808 RepID=A0ACA9Y5J0_9ASCO|nr:WD repeat-containing protein [[Candida] jaroonii]